MSFCERVVCTFTTLKCSVIRTSCNFLTSDVDECYNSTICGPYSICENLPGNYSCSCKVGFEPMDKTKQPNETNVCIGMWKLIYLYLKSLVFALSLCLCVSLLFQKYLCDHYNVTRLLYWVKKGLGWQNTLNHRVIAVLVSEGWINDELSKCSMKHWQCHGLAKLIQTFFFKKKKERRNTLSQNVETMQRLNLIYYK